MIRLENAKLSDIESIMKIEKVSFAPEIQENEETFLERIKVFPEGFFVFRAEDNENPIGYFSSELWTEIPDEKDFSVGHSIKKLHSKSGKIVYISSFALIPEVRGKGNGFLLFKESLKKLENIFLPKKETLLVNEKWLGAKKIYEKYGFSETKKIKNAFPDSNFGLFMEKLL